MWACRRSFGLNRTTEEQQGAVIFTTDLHTTLAFYLSHSVKGCVHDIIECDVIISVAEHGLVQCYGSDKVY